MSPCGDSQNRQSKQAFSRLSDDVQVVIFHTYIYRWETIIREEYDKTCQPSEIRQN